MCFVLYLLAGAMIYYRTIMHLVTGNINVNKIVIWATISLVIYFIMMLALLVILARMGAPAA